MISRYQYSCSLDQLRSLGAPFITEKLRSSSGGGTTGEQLSAWTDTIDILSMAFADTEHAGVLFFEYSAPRIGTRIDVVLIIDHVIFILEFKTGKGTEASHALDQVTDYALDLRYFHRTSHDAVLVPILITETENTSSPVTMDQNDDRMMKVVTCNSLHLIEVVNSALSLSTGPSIVSDQWVAGSYEPTPTIVEAARALYAGHKVNEITRSEAGARNISETSVTVTNIIHEAMDSGHKAICFVTGVPGAGKTLVGLDLATRPVTASNIQHCVYLSGNGPLVSVLREALTRDAHRRAKSQGNKTRKATLETGVKAFIQNVHHFRDEYLRTVDPPFERIVVFDEAQRAWNKEQTTNFMARKKGIRAFDRSEPEYLISCMDRHDGWAVIVCLVGNGQEINTGEAGIAEWLRALTSRYSEWKVFASTELGMSEEDVQVEKDTLRKNGAFRETPALHLSASIRSFRSEHVSTFVNQLLDFDQAASSTLTQIGKHFPIVLTRDVDSAKAWVRDKARGSERFGILASSAAERLRPYAIDVKAKVNPVHWFLNGKRDVRSSYYLETVATEFAVQGLELDWTVLAWDADFRCNYERRKWDQFSFRGDRWERVNKIERQHYQRNAYRVLLTRARQGMVIIVPHGASDDHTRVPEYYHDTFRYLESIGIPVI